MRFTALFLLTYLLTHITGYVMADIDDLPHLWILNDLVRSDRLLDTANPNLLACDGYLTANPTENFCSQSVPEDWVPLEFNGERFYRVPLSILHDANAKTQ